MKRLWGIVISPLTLFRRVGCLGKIGLSLAYLMVAILLCVFTATLLPETEKQATLPPAPTATPRPVAQPTPSPMPSSTSTPSPTLEPTPIPSATPEPTPTLSSEETVERLVVKALGSGNRDVDRITKIILADDDWVTLNWAANDSLTEGMIKSSAKRDIANVGRALCKAGYCNGLTMIGTFSMKDPYGNVSEDVVIQIVLRPETLARINWEYFDSQNVYVIADAVKLHPAFEE